ncbi:CopM family metallochaperone [Proteus hauseri]|uniref:CopM family metallochaperone n=1 Tax=Proteus hauseri TaxID=183417 RepID=UPI0032DBC2A5
MKKILPTMAILMTTLSFGAMANSPSHMNMPQSNSSMHKELNESMNKMHADMAKGMNSDNADVAFADGMIAHHLGAIDMAKIELKYGTDPEMRKLAQAIIDAQGPEIAQMKKWLDKNRN